jgi:UrcA family protein
VERPRPFIIGASTSFPATGSEVPHPDATTYDYRRREDMKRVNTVLFIMAVTTGAPVFAIAAEDKASRYNLVYSTSDFSSPAAVEALHKRIVRTAKSHCPSYFVSRSMADTRACVRDVVNDLVKVINNPMLSAFSPGKTVQEVAAEAAVTDSKS